MNYRHREISIEPTQLIAALLALPDEARLAMLDSSGVGHLGSHLLIAGIEPVKTIEIFDDPVKALESIDDCAASNQLAAIFTVSYEMGRESIPKHSESTKPITEPFVSIALFDSLIVHDYKSGKTSIIGNESKLSEVEKLLTPPGSIDTRTIIDDARYVSNFSCNEYVHAVEMIKEHIRAGDTYQVNLTQQLRVPIRGRITPEEIFLRLRADHPAPFGSFFRRGGSVVVSASPERFLKIEGRSISASPIKGTRKRGTTPAEDVALRKELLASLKDRAENTMIVDLLRNDLGRVCEFGSVNVDRLCEIEEHPTLFHLVSTISGTLRQNCTLGDVMLAAFPCGSITGAPKIRTMEIIDDIENVPRGLSMGAIGYSIPPVFGLSDQHAVDMSVAIRTMVIRNSEAVFNVGGGIVIDSDPVQEYKESLLKAKALLRALGCSDHV